MKHVLCIPFYIRLVGIKLPEDDLRKVEALGSFDGFYVKI
jgi:hypothetical protein